MSTTTTNYGLIKPDTSDPILIGQLNDNSDAIDAALKENADAIENKPDAADIPTPSTAAPAMDGTAAAGTSTDYARADHIHPSDTSKQDVIDSSHKLSADLVDDTNSTNKFNMQPDWNQSTNTAGDFIKNKPTLGTAAAAATTDFAPASHNQASNTINAMTGYTAPVNPSTWETVAATDTLNEAVQKLDNNSEINKTNISLIELMNGSKNKFNLTAWSNCTVTRGSKTINGTNITLTATGNNCYTAFANPDYPSAANIAVNEGEQIVITWNYSTTDSATGQVYVFPNGGVEGAIYRDGYIYDNLPFTVPSGCTFITIRFGVLENGKSATYSNVQVMSKAAYDSGFTEYQPYAMTNAEITAWILAHS